MERKIPSHFKVGGQIVEIRDVERSEDNSCGLCHISAGYIEIARKFNKDDQQSESSKVNTFYHELTHAIFLAGIVTAFVAILWDTLKDKRTIFTIDEDYRIIIKKRKK